MSAFGDQLKAARLKAGLTRGQLAARIGSGSGYVEKIENNRQALSSEQQRRLLEACRNPTLVDDFQQDMAVRLATLTNDIETLMAGLDVTRAAAAKAVAVAHPPKRRASK
jgi:transcriptional regulator with XRE-family HTH domain